MTPGKFIILFGLASIIVVALVLHILWGIGWLISMVTGFRIKYAPLGWCTLGISAIMAIALAYGYYVGRWRLCVKEMTYCHRDIPAAFDGFKIVHISDFHLGTFDDSPKQLETFIDEINSQNPDLICFTGDLVTLGQSEAEPYTDILKKINARNGVISVLGNHDLLIYGRLFGDSLGRVLAVDSLVDYEKNVLGWTLLQNSSKVLEMEGGDKITIIGVNNKNCSKQGYRTIDCGKLPEAMQGTDGFRILLTHDPSHWDAEVLPDTDIPLTLSGHTHSAQISLFGWTPASLMFKRPYGQYTEDCQTLYVNPGLGCTAPFRIGARPEITVIILKSTIPTFLDSR